MARKTHDFFVFYYEEDPLAKDFTTFFVERWEKEFGLKGNFHHRDAVTGEVLLHALNDNIEKSHITVVVFTRLFKTKAFQKYANVAAFCKLLNDVSTNSPRYIPVGVGMEDGEFPPSIQNVVQITKFPARGWERRMDKWRQLDNVLAQNNLLSEEQLRSHGMTHTPYVPPDERLMSDKFLHDYVALKICGEYTSLGIHLNLDNARLEQIQKTDTDPKVYILRMLTTWRDEEEKRNKSDEEMMKDLLEALEESQRMDVYSRVKAYKDAFAEKKKRADEERKRAERERAEREQERNRRENLAKEDQKRRERDLARKRREDQARDEEVVYQREHDPNQTSMTVPFGVQEQTVQKVVDTGLPGAGSGDMMSNTETHVTKEQTPRKASNSREKTREEAAAQGPGFVPLHPSIPYEGATSLMQIFHQIANETGSHGPHLSGVEAYPAAAGTNLLQPINQNGAAGITDSGVLVHQVELTSGGEGFMGNLEDGAPPPPLIPEPDLDQQIGEPERRTPDGVRVPWWTLPLAMGVTACVCWRVMKY